MTDFSGLMRPVAARLLGEPNIALSTATEIRFGSKGSLSINPADGTFYDHEAKSGGGVLALIQREQKCDKAGALAWLRNEGLIEDAPERASKSSPRIFYDYCDESGEVRYRVERTGSNPPFRQWAPDGRGGFHSAKGCMAGVELIPYRLPEVLAADPAALIYICEGEKDADRLAGIGLIATTNPGGAGKWRDSFAHYLTDRTCIILPDNDDAGRAHAADVKAKLRGHARDAAVLALPDLPDKGDVSDWLDAGGTVEQLHRLSLEALEAAMDEIPAADTVDPVDLWGTFDPPGLPHGLLPVVLERWARANADMMGCDPSGLAVAALATCATAIPDEIKLKVKVHDSWTESARIWVALVGDPSTKKSPILSAATGPLCRLDVELMRAWQERTREWEAFAPEEKKAKPRPAQTRLRIEDATIEAAQQVLEGSPWGIMLLQDELSGLFGAMDKYSGGKGAAADRAFWLRAFNGGEYALNRVSRGAALIPNLSVSMLGGIQPEPLRRIAGDAVDDGLLQRLFPIMLQRATLGRDEAGPSVNDQYRVLIEALRGLKPPGWMENGTLEFNAEAQGIRRDLEAKHLELQSLETINRKLAAHIGKYDGLFVRLCVIWHCVEHAHAHDGLPVVVTEETARRVGDFLHKFLLAHSVAFYAGCLGLSDDHDRLTAIAGHILAHKLETVTNRDVQRGDRTMRGLKDYEIKPLLEQLEALGWLERTEAPRPSSPPHFAVNPRVHTKFEAKGRAEALRRKEAREMIGGLVRS